MKLAIVLATAEERGDWARADRIARASRVRGHEVSIFVMADAIRFAASAQAAALVDEGCEVVCCGTNAHAAKIDAVVTVGSQDDHARIVGDADRLVALT